MKLIQSSMGKKQLKVSQNEWENIGKKAGWIKASMGENDLSENIRFYDPACHQNGKLVKRKYHQTTLWMMLYDDGTIEELTKSDLERIKKIDL